MTSAVVQANIDLHTQLAENYDTVEPHFHAENQVRVRNMLKRLRREAGGAATR